MSPGPHESRKPAFTGAGAAAAIPGAIGILALVAATFANVITIRAGGTSDLAAAGASASGWQRHGPALILVGAVAAVMLVGAVRGARPAMVGLLATGAAALAVALAGDLPDLHRTGAIGDAYAGASAGPGAGFHLELAGGILLIATGGAMLVSAARGRKARRPPRRRPST